MSSLYPRFKVALLVVAAVLFALAVFHQSDFARQSTEKLWNKLPYTGGGSGVGVAPVCEPISSKLSGNGRPSWYDIAMKAGTDKSTDHQYQYMYDKYLPQWRDKNPKFLEIGLGCNMAYGPGKSYKLWLEYFPKVQLYFLEYDAACAKEWGSKTAGATIIAGDQADVAVLNGIKKNHGPQFDIIIDDGGHTMNQQITSFTHLWEAIVPGGIYFIEDLHTAYLDGVWGGHPWGEHNRTGTAVEFIYEMIDELHVHPWAEGKHHALTKDIRGIDCIKEMCAIIKKDVLES